MTLLIPFPPTRINDRFSNQNSNIDFSFNEFTRDPIIKGLPNDLAYRFSADFYQQIGVDIVCETAFEYPYPFITEKTYRSINCLRPFIIVGPYQVLDFIKSFDFQTFSVIINESYDQIKNPEERFLSVCDSIKEFVSRPIEQIRNDITKVAPILEHNRKVLIGLVDKELEIFRAKV
jgi:hypothetical protein